MIRKIFDKKQLFKALDKAPDVYSEKIRALAEAYGLEHEFCSFYLQTGGTVISDYYRSAVVANCGKRAGDRLAELMEFLTCGIFRKVILPYSSFDLSNTDANISKLYVMKYTGGVREVDGSEIEMLDGDFAINNIYDIASDGFDIDFNKWYTDTSHMVRHGISRLYALGKKACAVKMFSSSGITYLSYVCTRDSERGKGYATRLLKWICSKEAAAGNTVYVLCEPRLGKFYERVGFEFSAETAEITI